MESLCFLHHMEPLVIMWQRNSAPLFVVDFSQVYETMRRRVSLDF